MIDRPDHAELKLYRKDLLFSAHMFGPVNDLFGGGNSMKHMRFVFPVLFLLIILCICSGATAQPVTVVASGMCGENAEWTLYYTGTMEITGFGDMYDWEDLEQRPWDEYYHDVKRLLVGDEITSIGENAFCGCNYLTDVVLGDGVRDIRCDAFCLCAVSRVTFGSGLQTIGETAFFDCNLQGTLILPDSVYRIDDGAFSSNFSLKAVKLPANLETLGAHAFTCCFDLSEIVMGDQVSYIGAGAFKQTNITEFTVPRYVTSLEPFVFLGCRSLEKVYIHGNCRTVDYTAFTDCSELKDIYFYGTESDRPEIADSQQKDYGFDRAVAPLIEAEWHYVRADGNFGTNASWTLEYDGTLYISGSGDMPDFQSQGAPWYRYRSYVSGLKLDPEITSVGAHMFEDCAFSGMVSLPDKVTKIGNYAFRNCSGILLFGMPYNSLTSIGNYAFQGCTQLYNIYIPDSVLNIGNYAFNGCERINEIMLLKTSHLKTIGQHAFEDCSNVRTLTLPGNVTQIGDYAFAGCTALKEVTFPSGSLTSIGGHAFEGCTGLGTAVIPKSVGTIGAYAFSGCEELAQIGLPAGLTYIEEGTFSGCKLLEKADIPSTVTAIGPDAFSSCIELSYIKLYSAATSIGTNAFVNCGALRDVYYVGTEYRRSQIAIGSGNSDLTLADWHCVVDSGECGDDAQWWLDADGVLTVTGTGSMTDWTMASRVPWYGVRSQIKSVTIETGITSVGSYAFNDCQSLVYAFVPATVTSVGARAFGNCLNMCGISLGDPGLIFGRLTNIGENAFAGCASLRNVYYYGSEITRNRMTVGQGNTLLTANTCTWHYMMYLPSGFCGDAATWKITCDENGYTLHIYGTGSMYDHASSADMPWYDYNGLINSVEINGISVIGERSFMGMTSLKTVTLGSEVTSMGNSAFGNDSGITDVYYNGSHAMRNNIDFRFWNNYLENAEWHYIIGHGTCGSGVEWELSEEGALVISGSGDMWSYSQTNRPPWYQYADEYIKTVTVGGNVESIGAWAFADCDVREAVIGDSVTLIGQNAFSGNGSLGRLTLGSGITQIRTNAFSGVKLDINVYPLDHPYFAGVCYAGTNMSNIDIQAGNTDLTDAVWHCGPAYGACGEDAEWFLYADGLLEIYGTGAMTDWASKALVPWDGYRDSITRVHIYSRITNVGGYAFADCTGLVSVHMSNKTNEISDSAFMNCSALEWPSIPASLRSIGERAFMGCSGFENVIIPEGVVSIGGQAFESCMGMKSILFAYSVTEIGNWAVRDENALTDIYFCRNSSEMSDISVGYMYYNPHTVKVHTGTHYGVCGSSAEWILDDEGTLVITGSGAMYDWNAGQNAPWLGLGIEIRSVDIGGGITKVGAYAFADCDKLTGIVLPESVTTVGEGAFEGCTSLTKAEMPGVKHIKEYAFMGCPGIEKAELGAAVADIGRSAFEACTGLKDVYYAGTDAADIDIDDTDDGNRCLEDADWHYSALFGSCGDKLDWMLSEGILRITGRGDMYDWSSAEPAPWYEYRYRISSVKIDGSVTYAGAYAFSGCVNLGEAVVPASVGYRAFEGCTLLENVEVKSGTFINEYAFAGCTSLARISLNKYIGNIARAAFANCSSLTDVYYEGTETEKEDIEIGTGNDALSGAVWHCAAHGGGKCGADAEWILHVGSITDTLEITGTGLMYDYGSAGAVPWKGSASNIGAVIVDEGIVGIGSYAFAGCDRLYSVRLADSVKIIGAHAFENSADLKQLKLPERLLDIGESAFRGSGLTGVILPESLTTIGQYAFSGCCVLEYAAIPGDTSIEEHAFVGCSALSSVTLGGDVKIICSGAFKNCSSLEDVYYAGDDISKIEIGEDNGYLTGAVWHYGKLAEGQCGANVYWTLDTGFALNITGSGAMYSYTANAPDPAPWERYRESIKSVTVSDAVTEIGAYAFAYCSALEEAVLPGAVKIGEGAFRYCDALRTVSFGACLARVENNAFDGCYALSKVWYAGTGEDRNGIYFGSGNQYLNSYLTWDCEALLGRCGEEAYWSLRNGTLYITGKGDMSVWMSEDEVPWYAYRAEITRIDIADGITDIGMRAFANCTALTDADIPRSVKRISANAFKGCTSLEEIKLYGVHIAGAQAFSGCSNLKSVYFDDELECIYDQAFYNCAALTDIYYLGTETEKAELEIRTLGNDAVTGAAWHCIGGSDTMTLPAYLREIGSEAFGGTGAVFIVIPETCESIAPDAFAACDDLKFIINHSNAYVTAPAGVTVINDR